MKKAVITILGTITCCDKDGNWNKNNKAIYEVDDRVSLSLKNKFYTNMLPILIEKYYKEYDIVPIFTNEAKEKQCKVLRECEDIENVDEVIEKIFKNGIELKDENDFKLILELIDKKISEYDEVIVDITHGFRHLPILMTIDLIITSLKNKSKVKNIFFAQEIEKFKKYKIIDLKEYLELSNIAFLINTFRANYTVSNHIEVSKEEYINLRNLMKQFSNNLMALSIDYLLDYVTPNLINSLNSLSNTNSHILIAFNI